MRALPRLLVLVSSLLAASPALAQRICVVPFTGPGAPAVRNQVVAGLCDTSDCIAPAKVTAGNKPDWKKAKKESVTYFVVGTIAKKGKATQATLQVMTKPGAPKFSKVYALDGGELSAKTLASALDGLKSAMGVVSSTPAPERPTPTPTPEPTVSSPPPTPPRPVEPSRPPERNEPEPAGFDPDDGLKMKPAPKKRQPFVVIEAGADVLSRSLSYVGATTSNLRKYDVFFVMPEFQLQLFPVALANQGLLSGLGVEGGISLATWLKSSRQGQTEAYPTRTMKVDAGLLWRIMPSSSFDLAIVPFAGIRLHNFTVGALADGTKLDGLPGLNYFGLRAGIGIDVPLADNFFIIFARFAVLPIFTSGEIISAAYFKAGTNLGLEGSAGIGIRIIPHLYVRLQADFTRYGITFKTSPGDTYIATGAIDQYLGGTAGIRFEY